MQNADSLQPAAALEPKVIEVDGTQLTLRRCEAAEILALRHQILRFGLAFDEAKFEGDDLPTSHHFGAFDPRGAAICCATFMLNEWGIEPAWQLRGMATDAKYQGRGIGNELLQLAEQAVLAAGPTRLFWCNARVPALAFYDRRGWRVVSEEFDIPTAGPHRKLIKRN